MSLTNDMSLNSDTPSNDDISSGNDMPSNGDMSSVLITHIYNYKTRLTEGLRLFVCMCYACPNITHSLSNFSLI